MNGIDQNINILSDICEAIGSKKINIDMISQTAPMDGKVSVSFTIPKNDIDECITIIKNLEGTKNLFVDKDITKFSVVGIGIKETSCVASKMFKLFTENGIDIKLIATSQIRITCAIKQEDKEKAVNLVADKFNL
jgi:aspartate kinase